MSARILLVLGAGNNVGLHTAAAFEKQGYRVAVVSRSISAHDYPEYLTINADFADPEAIRGVFDQVRAQLGEPNVVLYNAVYYPRVNQHLLDIPVAEYQKSLQVNTIAPYVSAQHAVESFSRVANGGPKTFLYTGNCLNNQVVPRFWAMGAPKSASAHMIAAAALSYDRSGFRYFPLIGPCWTNNVEDLRIMLMMDNRFYYVDERTPQGGPMYDALNGEAHAKIFWELSHLQTQERPIVTFVNGKGRVDFDP